MGNGQKTIAAPASLSGIGLHLGEQNHVQIMPGRPNQGIVFWSMRGNEIASVMPAHINNITSGILRTVLGSGETRIETIEHILAAMRGMEIDNVVIKVWGNEMPMMDGSSLAWVDLIQEAGIVDQMAASRKIVITKEILVVGPNAWCSLRPSMDGSFTIRYDISYPHPMIGHQRLGIVLNRNAFIRNLAAARTFGFISELESIRSLGLARGANEENVIAFNDDGIAGSNQLRWSDEPIRHKMVDAVGDLSLAGHPLVGIFTGYRSGHILNQRLVSALLDDRSAWFMSDQ